MAQAPKTTTSSNKEKKEIADSAGHVSDDFKALREDVDELIQHIGLFAREETKDGVKQVRKAGGKAMEEGEEAVSRSRDYIRDNPLIACAVALGAGFVAASLVRR